MMSITVTKSMLIDALSLAEEFEERLDGFLRPCPLGFYLPGESEPAMKAGQYYYQMVRSLGGSHAMEPFTQVVIQKHEDIVQGEGDIYDEKHNVVIPRTKLGQITYGPTLPVRGLNIVQRTIDAILDSSAAWIGDKRGSMIDVVEPFLTDDIVANKSLMAEISERINAMTLDLRTDIIDFISVDNWIMHFTRRLGLTGIVIEKTIDYRIYDWENRMNSGEWKK